MTAEVTVILAAALIAIVAGVYYLRGPVGKKSALFLWIVRCTALLLLLCAFFQPAFTFKTLATDEGSVAVLIDASKSMRLFRPDSLLLRLGDFFSAQSSAKPSVRFFLFGDSLRSCDPSALHDISFIDNHSFFPMDLSKWRTIVILSDGNWSNPSLATNAFENKNCIFFPLPAPSPRPFLRCECVSFQSPVLKDSVAVAAFGLRGYKSAGNPLEIEVRRNAKPLFYRQRAMNAGYFNDTISLTFPAAQAGRFLYSVRVRNSTDTLSCQWHLVGDVVPTAFHAAIVSSSPSLDARFLSLALVSDPHWKIDNSDDGVRTADALFLLDWNAKAKKAFSELKPSGVGAFVGCLPCSNRFVVTPDTFALFSPQPGDSLAQRILQRNLPSPAQVVSCGGHFFSGMQTRLGCVVHKKTAPHPASGPLGGDTLPFLFSGVFNGRSIVALASRNIWHMEFLPLGVDQENESGSLLLDVISIVKESVISRLTRTFFAYPLASEVNEYDSCAFCIVLPPELTASQRTSRGSSMGRIDFSIRHGEKRILDTAFMAEEGMMSGTQTFRCSPLGTGTYAFSAVLSFKKKRFSWTDTIDIHENDLEFSIQGQNTILLNQIAVPFEGNDPQSFSTALNRNQGLARNATTTGIYQIKRTWALWGIIIALFVLEWAMRRKCGMDG